MRLKLRRGTVVALDPLTVQVGGAERRAWADEALLGPCEIGDEVIVNTQALDLELGSGGFDIVHVNASRGLEEEGSGGAHVMKLNYTSLQHPVEPVERCDGAPVAPIPVLVISLHGHLAPAAWAAAQHTPGLRIGFVQAAGGALPGSLSRDIGRLRELGLLAGHVTAAPSYGGDREAMSVCGALDAAGPVLGWQAAIVGPGPGIIGSETRLGHGGMAALDAAHAAAALGSVTYLSPRMSGSDPRPRHRGLSHHTETVLGLLLSGVGVPVPELDLAEWFAGEHGESPLDVLHRVCEGRHDIFVQPVDLEGYAKSGLPRATMGRDLADDPLFFAAPLAAGRALAAAVGPGR